MHLTAVSRDRSFRARPTQNYSTAAVCEREAEEPSRNFRVAGPDERLVRTYHQAEAVQKSSSRPLNTRGGAMWEEQ